METMIRVTWGTSGVDLDFGVISVGCRCERKKELSQQAFSKVG